jgi:RNA 3'-phosphate cyclase
MLDIDGAHGEGGGQLLRTAVTLAAVTGRPVRIHDIRAHRRKPGLAAQHLTAVRAVGELCNARVEGLALGARELSFVPGALRGGEFRFDVGTAGSVTLVLQALVPVMLASDAACRVVVTGGTDVRAAPPLDYFRAVLLGLLERMGARLRVAARRRGYFPGGGGEVELAVEPGARLSPFAAESPGRLRALRGAAHVGNLPAHIAVRMRDAALAALQHAAQFDLAVLGEDGAQGHGGAVVAWAETEASVLGAGEVAERGVPAETLGARVGAGLRSDLEAGASLDTHAADQLLVHLALAGGRSVFTTRTLSSHARTAMWLIEQFLPARFATAAQGTDLKRVEVR